MLSYYIITIIQYFKHFGIKIKHPMKKTMMLAIKTLAADISLIIFIVLLYSNE